MLISPLYIHFSFTHSLGYEVVVGYLKGREVEKKEKVRCVTNYTSMPPLFLSVWVTGKHIFLT